MIRARLPVVDYSRIYTDDPIDISLKPQPLPQYLYHQSPGSDEHHGMGPHRLVPAEGVVVGEWEAGCWAGLRPPNSWRVISNPSQHTTNMIDQAYKSSLVAHLTVQSKSSPINSFEDVLGQTSWSWGGQAPLLHSAYAQVFTKSPSSTLQDIYKHMEIRDVDDGLARVMENGYSFITWKYYIESIIAITYTDTRGVTAFYTSRKEYSLLLGHNWGFTKGSPLRRPISAIKQRPDRGGAHRLLDGSRVDDGQVVLSLHHLQSVFFLLLLGYCVSCLVLLGEKVSYYLQRSR
ncbi:Glutamate receptor ionotropic, kainate 1-like 4 [Homarus americanus]|uniref:Glutamate receptor ionotropic, kainate 1-like 4 n=1 Tax=Homarus americanus TaxID=6706 RepID=A0A8J5TC46_HOMAM|nr:Glutamate receptor ionotropic, kainate 1-like 4 [Homarus americanus]